MLAAFLLAAGPAPAQQAQGSPEAGTAVGGDPSGELGATVRRTRYGVPHIVANDYAGAAYGQAYAFAEDNLCTLADSIVTVSGERSRWFGADGEWTFSGNGSTYKNLDSDFFYTRINGSDDIQQLLDSPPPQGPLPEIREAVRGFVAGYNAYLRDVGGSDGLSDERCKGEPWVRPISEIDLYRRFFQIGSLASSGVAIDGIANAAPLVGAGPTGMSAQRRETLTDRLGTEMRSLGGGLGSNAYGLGGDATDNGKGMMLGNPHFPWAGAERLYQSHITIPGELDVSGSTLYGVPAILIGHTRGLAWSHTVATAWRFTPFELKLVPGDPYSYLHDGQPRRMEATQVTVKARNADGSLQDRTRTLYETVHGPMFTSLLGLPLFPWGPTTAYAFGDVNATNFRYLNHFLETDRAQSVREYDEIQRRFQGIPWVNSLAADSSGESYYSMGGAIPNVPNDKVASCPTALGQVTFPTLGLPTLDGSRSECEWGTAPGAAAPGLLPPDEIPRLFRRDYVHNGNDSHWLANPAQRLEGFERIVGIERAEVTPRTRLGLVMLRDRLASADGLPGNRFSLDGLKEVALNNRQYLGELWRDRLVSICRANPTIGGTDVSGACPVLAAWDRRDELDSPGALLFRRFATRAFPATQSLPTGTQGSQPIGDRAFTEPFDPARPIDTPNGLADSEKVRNALASAVRDLNGAGIPLDATLRSHQRDGNSGAPIHGGPGGLGVFNAISAPWNGKGLDPVEHGSSFVMAARFQDGACPVRSDTFVTYGQSENPTSERRRDYTRAFSEKRWNEVPFCLPDVLAAVESVTRLGNACTSRGGLRSARVSTARRGALRIGFRRGRRAAVRADLFRATPDGMRPVAATRRSRPFSWRPRGLRRGSYVVRLRMRAANGRISERSRPFAYRGARVRRLPAFTRDERCAMLERFAVQSPVFDRRGLRVRFRLDRDARATVRLVRGKRTIRSVALGRKAGERTHTVRLRRLPAGRYRVTIGARSPGGQRTRGVLRSRRD